VIFHSYVNLPEGIRMMTQLKDFQAQLGFYGFQMIPKFQVPN
jgi:hypothetical protein